MLMAFPGCWLARDGFTAFRDLFTNNLLEYIHGYRVRHGLHDDKTRGEAVASGSSTSVIIFHVNEASRHVMMLMHQQHIDEATA